MINDDPQYIVSTEFTFHYVSILIRASTEQYIYPGSEFTFHYVSILIVSVRSTACPLPRLHSIMSLF